VLGALQFGDQSLRSSVNKKGIGFLVDIRLSRSTHLLTKIKLLKGTVTCSYVIAVVDNHGLYFDNDL